MSYRVDIDSLEDEKLKQEIRHELNNELKILKEIIYEQMEGLHSIGKIKNGQMNKFHVLIEASKLGIDIPRSSIYDNSKRVVSRFKNAKIITKAISETPIFKINNKENEEEIYTGYTSEIHLNDLEKNIEFFPSLIQEKLDKKIELRIFFLEEDFYTMAIFSQNDNKTSIDFRKYNTDKPNRTMPFNLPIEIKTKLKKLIRKLDLVSGSIDMVLTNDDRYVFLEVNPVGQFGMVSYPCNYKIEKRIAKYLAQ